jgi:hypothetical protein
MSKHTRYPRVRTRPGPHDVYLRLREQTHRRTDFLKMGSTVYCSVTGYRRLCERVPGLMGATVVRQDYTIGPPPFGGLDVQMRPDLLPTYTPLSRSKRRQMRKEARRAQTSPA